MPYVEYNAGRKRRRRVSEALVSDIISALNPHAAWVEDVHAMPRQGVTSSFNFGMSTGIVRGVLAARLIPVHFVSPALWKRHFQLGADKQQARLRATNLFPEHADLFRRRLDDGRAEALLLAVYGARHQAVN